MADEPQFMAVSAEDPEYQRTIRQAQATLDDFRRLAASGREVGALTSFKTLVVDGDNRAFLWLSFSRVNGAHFVGKIAEIPGEFGGYRVGGSIEVTADAVTDWMVNENGVLHGGFSLRYQRSKLPEEKRAGFDDYIGVTRYAAD
jgi:uncharacterized protein YegJ (DUF2314 family)